MEKDKITISAVKEDLLKQERFKMAERTRYRLCAIIPFLIFSSVVIFNATVLGAILFTVPAYQLIRLIIEYAKYCSHKKAIRFVMMRDDVSISTEVFSHHAEETVFEPHFVGTRLNLMKTVQKFHFKSGTEWREPLGYTLYEWSENYYRSPKGLENSSISGDEFYYIHLQRNVDISYIYPCKNFEIDIK